MSHVLANCYRCGKSVMVPGAVLAANKPAYCSSCRELLGLADDHAEPPEAPAHKPGPRASSRQMKPALAIDVRKHPTPKRLRDRDREDEEPVPTSSSTGLIVGLIIGGGLLIAGVVTLLVVLVVLSGASSTSASSSGGESASASSTGRDTSTGQGKHNPNQQPIQQPNQQPDRQPNQQPQKQVPRVAFRPNPPPDVPGKKTVDLLPLIDPKKDAVDNRKWFVVDGVLWCDDQHFVPKIQIPYQPPEEYDFVVTFSQPALRNGVALILPNPAEPGASFFWGVGGGNGTEYAFGRKQLAFPGKTANLVRADTAHTTVVQVRRDGVRALLDGKELARADLRDLACDNWRNIRDKSLLALACDDPTVFYDVRVIEITGSGKATR